MNNVGMKMRKLLHQALAQFNSGIWATLSGILLTILFISLALLTVGKNPLEAFVSIFQGAFGSRNAIAEVLVKMSPLLLAGLGTAIAFRCQIWNIGAEGQLLVGALAASLVALFLPNLPPVLSLVVAISAAILAGGLWAGIAGILKVKLGTSEIINTIMLNYVAIFLINYLLRGPLKDSASYVPQTSIFPDQFLFPIIMPLTRLHLGIILALVAAVVVYIIQWKTPVGFNIIAVGSNPKAAKVGGISVAANIVIAMLISGGLSGMAGANEVFGLYHRFLDGVSAGYGFSAMAVAILGNLNPIGITVFSFILAALRVGADHMQRQMGVPASIVYLIEGMLIVFIQGRYMLPRLVSFLRGRNIILKSSKDE